MRECQPAFNPLALLVSSRAISLDSYPPDLLFDTRYPYRRSGSTSSIASDNMSNGGTFGKGFIRLCETCDRAFDRPSSYAVHMRSHSGEQPYVCTFERCVRRFSTQSNLNRHVRTVHQDVASLVNGD